MACLTQGCTYLERISYVLYYYIGGQRLRLWRRRQLLSSATTGRRFRWTDGFRGIHQCTERSERQNGKRCQKKIIKLTPLIIYNEKITQFCLAKGVKAVQFYRHMHCTKKINYTLQKQKICWIKLNFGNMCFMHAGDHEFAFA